MADSKKTVPQRFSADLFSSSPSSGLSLGLDENFRSPFSISLVTANKDEDTPKPLSSSRRASPAPGVVSSGMEPQVIPSPAKDNAPVSSSGGGELCTVPLDSPTSLYSSSEPLPPSLTTAVARSSTDSALIGLGQEGKATRPEYKYGWNDPPTQRLVYGGQGDTPHRPHVSRTATAPAPSFASSDNVQIQPLANHPHTPASQSGPPAGAAADAPASSNPYRIGTGVGARKPAYGTSGIASFGPTSSGGGQSSQPNVGPPGYQHIPSAPLQPSGAFQGLQDMSSPPTSGLVGSSSSSSSSSSLHPHTDHPDGGWGEHTSRSAPIRHHWFYLRSQESYWIPFSLVDSGSLESAILSSEDPTQQVLVPTDGGRYDVDFHSRHRKAVYWDEPASQVRRCSWFYKGDTERWFLPYSEATSQQLEDEYQAALSGSLWNHRVELGDGDYVVMHSHSSIVHYTHSPGPSPSPSLDFEQAQAHPMAVMRGFAELDKVETGEQSRVDHLVFIVHGIGGHHDLSFKCLVDCVDDFREVSQLMLKTHRFSKQAAREGDNGGRVEFLPVHWHSKLHTTGVDDRLKPLTLPSISRLRDFTNSTLLDILYFTSPLFCQTIVTEVASEMNRMYEIFKERNPSFQGGQSVVGHSLGSVILFDLLYHQRKAFNPLLSAPTPCNSASHRTSNNLEAPGNEGEGVAREEEQQRDSASTVDGVLNQLNLESLIDTFHKEEMDLVSLLMCSNEDLKELGLGMGPRKKLSSFIVQENQRLDKLMVERLERLERKQREAKEATDAAVTAAKLFEVKIIKGVAGTGQAYVEYPQLLFQPQQLFAIGSPIGLFLTVRGVEDLGPDFALPTCPSVFNIFHPFDPVAYRIEPLVLDSAPKQASLMPHHKGRKRFHLELYENLGYVGASIKHHLVEGMRNMWQQLNDLARSHTGSKSIDQQDQQVTEPLLDPASASVADEVNPVPPDEQVPIGRLNQGRRIDHVLQEKPLEKLNEYLFAVSSHLCYWHSEDTALFILKEVYQEPNAILIKT